MKEVQRIQLLNKITIVTVLMRIAKEYMHKLECEGKQGDALYNAYKRSYNKGELLLDECEGMLAVASEEA